MIQKSAIILRPVRLRWIQDPSQEEDAKGFRKFAAEWERRLGTKWAGPSS